MNIDCPIVLKECAPCLDDPSANTSAEAPDRPIIFGPRIIIRNPPLGRIYTQPGCLGICTSEISQADADACAVAAALLCVRSTEVPMVPPVVYRPPPPLPVVTVLATEDRTEFGEEPGVFTISRTGSTAGPLTVTFTLGGGAVGGTDYDTVPFTVTIPAGESSITIQIVPLDTGETEDKTVVLTITTEPTYTKGPSATVVIGPPPVVTIEVTQNLTEYGQPPASITLTRTGDLTNPLVLPYTWDGDGVVGVDFTVSASSPIIIPAGQASVEVFVTAIHDHDPDTHNPEFVFTSSPDYSFFDGVDYAEITINRHNFLDFVWDDVNINTSGAPPDYSDSFFRGVFSASLSCDESASAERIGSFIHAGGAARNCNFHIEYSGAGLGVAGSQVWFEVKINGVAILGYSSALDPHVTDHPFTIPASGSSKIISIRFVISAGAGTGFPSSTTASGTITEV